MIENLGRFRRIAVIKTYLSSEEKRSIEDKAFRAGMDVSTFARIVLLNSDVEAFVSTSLCPQAKKEARS